jgi:hypothetical protein
MKVTLFIAVKPLAKVSPAGCGRSQWRRSQLTLAILQPIILKQLFNQEEFY